MADATFTHKNVEITLDSFGTFRATVGGKTQRAASLDAMKRRIDKAAEEAFQPFYALAPADRGLGLKRVKIVSRQHSKRNDSYSRNAWVDDKGQTYDAFSHYGTTLMPDTDEARAAWDRKNAADEAHGAAERERRAAQEALPRIAWDYVPSKATP